MLERKIGENKSKNDLSLVQIHIIVQCMTRCHLAAQTMHVDDHGNINSDNANVLIINLPWHLKCSKHVDFKLFAVFDISSGTNLGWTFFRNIWICVICCWLECTSIKRNKIHLHNLTVVLMAYMQWQHYTISTSLT